MGERRAMPERFLGFDHVDTRVRSLAAVEPFYDAIMPELGLGRKTYSFVDERGEWHKREGGDDYNTIEYHEDGVEPGELGAFIGFIESPDMTPVATRIAFTVRNRSALIAWEKTLKQRGARAVEFSEDMEDYPALFFEDPAGTRLELCARLPKRPG